MTGKRFLAIFSRLLLRLEGVAVGTFDHGGIGLMGTNIYLGKRTEILGFAVICALGNGAADALVGVHVFHLSFCGFTFIICCVSEFIPAIKGSKPCFFQSGQKKHGVIWKLLVLYFEWRRGKFLQ